MIPVRRPSVLPTAALVIVGTCITYSNEFLRESPRDEIAFVAVATLYLASVAAGLYFQRRTKSANQEPTRISWVRRIRWMVLAALPVAVGRSGASFIVANLSPIPLLWFLPAAFVPIAWVVAFSRFAGRSSTALGMLAELCFVAPVAVVCMILMAIMDHDQNASFISALALAFLPIALLMPRRLTLPIQAILIAIALAPMFVEWPTSVTFSLAVHLSLIAVTCRGCQDVAVRDLPPPDLRLEFAVCALAGYFIAVVGVDVLPPLLFPDWSPEYPIALVTALLVRLIHWRASHRLDPTFEPKLDDRITAVSPS